MRYWNVGRCKLHSGLKCFLMSLSMCDFCNSVSFSQHHWTSVMLSSTGVYGCPNCPNYIRIRSLERICLFWGLCKSGLYHAKIYGTEGATNVTNTAQNHQLDFFLEICDCRKIEVTFWDNVVVNVLRHYFNGVFTFVTFHPEVCSLTNGSPFGGWIIRCWHLWPIVAFVITDLCGREGLWLWRRRRPLGDGWYIQMCRLPGPGKQDIRSWTRLKV